LNHELGQQKPLSITRDSTISQSIPTYTSDKHLTIFYRKVGDLIVVHGCEILTITKGDGARHLQLPLSANFSAISHNRLSFAVQLSRLLQRQTLN
jgi:hypothetical protein